MKSIITLLLLLIVPIFSACTNGGSEGSHTAGTTPTAVVLSFESGAAAQSASVGGTTAEEIGIAKISISVEGPGMTPMTEQYDIEPGQTEFQTELAVPNGEDRIFIADAYDGNGNPHYSGRTKTGITLTGEPTALTGESFTRLPDGRNAVLVQLIRIESLPDSDQDGYTADIDCDDTDASIHPNAYDTPCDGIDQDCNSTDSVDTSCTDGDGDGYTADLDCNDSDASVNPGADDSNCNNVDDDCNDEIDDGYVTTATSCGVGACAAIGRLVCWDGVVRDTCKAGTPAADDAGCNGVDDDCDGSVDEDYVADASCGVGVCQTTNTPSRCVNGVESPCQAGSPVEITDVSCDGIDGDCDGQIDEDYVVDDTCGVGACKTTNMPSSCAGGVETACQAGTAAPVDPICNGNGIDDDCDGSVDEDPLLLGLNTTTDAADANPGDGLCDDGAGNCTLRAAIQEANACPGADVIDVPAGTYPLTLGAALGITDDLTVRGAGAASTLVDGAANLVNGIANKGARIFTVGANLAAVTLQDLTLQNVNTPWGGGALSVGSNSPTVVRRVVMRGNQAAYGGAVSMEGNSDLTVIDSTITGNRITGGPGGSAFILFGGNHLTIRSSTLSYNGPSGSGSGSGVILEWNNGAAPVVTIENSTIAGNLGVGIHLYEAQAAITNSTITNNSADGVRAEKNAAVTLTNSILHGNGPNCSVNGGTITSGGHNLDGRDTCGFTAAGDRVNTDPMLGPLADNGGPTYTRGLLAGSPALNTGDNTVCPATDQRGVPRSNGTCDIGAYEDDGTSLTATCLSAPLRVDSPLDAVDANIGDGICDDGTGNCTLRAAIQETNACVGTDVIDLQPLTYALTIAGTNENASATGDLDITDDLTINGSGAAATVVDGSDAAFGDRLFHVLNHVTTTFDGLTLQGVNVAWNVSGGAIATGGNTTISNCTISGNTAGSGNGIYSWDAASTLNITNSTLSNNSGSGNGGAVYVAGTLNASGCTFSGNHFPYEYGHSGAAIYGAAGSTLSITNTVIDNNAAGYAEAVYGGTNATIDLTDSTVSNTQAGRALRGGNGSTVRITRSDITNNLEGGVACGHSQPCAGLTVTDSTIDGNTGTAVGSFSFHGAGIYSDGAFTITGSTISGNRIINGGYGGGGDGAGIYIGGPGTITNSTISGNRNGGQYGRGGGIGGPSTLTLINSTVYGNSAPYGGGIGIANGSLSIANSIVAGNSTNCDTSYMPVTSNGHNIESADTCGFADPTDQINTDPLLGPLADNGGPTQTHALQAGSPAIDGGDDALCPATDQRGVARPADGDGDGTAACDIGAYERDGSDLNITPFNTTVLGYSGDSIVFTATGGVPPYSWSAAGPLNGILTPNGSQATWTEDWNCSTSTLTGTVTVTDSLGNSATATITTSGNDC